jgi:dTDP-4-dehydrorhamnose 3,5-epimerase
MVGNLIDGVVVENLKKIVDERGWLMEILRSDWELFEKFRQVYVTAARPKVVKAWHMHKRQTDNLACVSGEAKLVLYDGRGSSKTNGEINEFIMGVKNPILVKIPAEVWHGFEALGEELAIVVNVPTALYNYEKPDECRLPPDTKEIPYDWKLTPGLKHG